MSAVSTVASSIAVVTPSTGADRLDAAELDAKIAEMRRSFGEIGDQRLTVMAAITIADEMSEARRKIEALQAEVASVNETREAALHATDGWATALAEALDAASARIEGLTQQMNAGWRKP